MEHYTVHLTVEDESGQPVPSAAVEVLQGEEVVIVRIELDGHYPVFQVIELGAAEHSTTTLTLVESGGFFQVYATDPPNLGDLCADDTVITHCCEGTLADLLTARLTNLGDFWAIRVYGEAAALDGGGTVNLGLFSAGLSAAIFQELMFGAAGIMPADVVEFCFKPSTWARRTTTCPACRSATWWSRLPTTTTRSS